MLKTILGVKRQTSNLACRLECKREPEQIYIMSQMYKFYYRLAKLDNKRILYNAHLTDCRMYQEKSKSGINNIIKSYEYIGKESFKSEVDHDKKYIENELVKVEYIETESVQLVHTKERSYQCQICPEKINEASHLKKHTKVNVKLKNVPFFKFYIF